jgi:hypothetical protein
VYLLERAFAAQARVREAAPVVEIAGNDEGRVSRNLARKEVQQARHLRRAVRLAQREVHAGNVQGMASEPHVHHAVQQAATLGAADRDVDVAPARDRVFREEGVAVVAAGNDGVPPVGVAGPDGVGQHLVLAPVRSRPDRDADLLQAHKVSPGGLQRLAHQGQRLPAAQGIETLVCVQSNQPHSGGTAVVGFR